MSTAEFLFALVLVVVLLTLGLYYGWRQIQASRRLRQQPGMDPSERLYLTRRAQRRIVCSILMLIFAGFLIGWFFLEPELESVTPPAPDQNAEHPLVKTVTYYWIAALFVLFGLLALAAIDLVATARHGFRSVRRLATQRQAEIEEDLARLRRQRAELN